MMRTGWRIALTPTWSIGQLARIGVVLDVRNAVQILGFHGRL
jgi:hypothetical protein